MIKVTLYVQIRSKTLEAVLRVIGAGNSGFGFRVLNLGLKVSCLVFRVSGLRFVVSGLRFGVSGFRVEVSG